MILTLKLSGLAFEINSAATAPADDVQGANSDALKKINFMDVIHYSFGYMGVLTGKIKTNNYRQNYNKYAKIQIQIILIYFCRSVLPLQDVLGLFA